MWKYVLKRIFMLIPVVVGVSLIIFSLLSLTPGDPADTRFGETASEEVKAEWREKQGLDDPFVVRYGKWMWNIITKFDFGSSYKNDQPVLKEVLKRFPTTFLMSVLLTTIASLIGVLLGVLAATHQKTIIDDIARVIGMVGASIPSFWLALLLIMYFAVELKWFPVSGWYGPKYWVLPACSMGFMSSAQVLRNTRSSMLDCIRQDYVRTARSKGQRTSIVTWHHIFRNALIPIINSIGTLFGNCLAGTVVIENIFSIPGLGRLMVNGINNRDYPTVQCAVFILAIVYSLVNLVIDIIYAYVDPRIRSRYVDTGKQKKKAAASLQPTSKHAVNGGEEA